MSARVTVSLAVALYPPCMQALYHQIDPPCLQNMFDQHQRELDK